MRWWVLALVVMHAVVSSPAQACPACSLENLMATNVRSSENVYVGLVLRQIDDNKAEVEVIEVLRGYHEVGARIPAKMWLSEKYIGETFIFSDPTVWPPAFEVLPLVYKDEVQFLLGAHLEVVDLDHAVWCVQGASSVTQALGMDYIVEHYSEAAPLLATELDMHLDQVSAGQGDFLSTHRIDKLAEALLQEPSEAAQDYLFRYIDRFLMQPSLPLRSLDNLSYSSTHGVILRSFLLHAERHPRLYDLATQHLLAAFPSLEDQSLSEATCALVLSDTPLIRIQSRVADHQQDAYARGLLLAGNQYELEWRPEAPATLRAALGSARDPRLRAEIIERMNDR